VIDVRDVFLGVVSGNHSSSRLKYDDAGADILAVAVVSLAYEFVAKRAGRRGSNLDTKNATRHALPYSC